VCALAFVVPAVSELGVGWALPLKIALTVALIAPAGFLMGMPFPTGLTQLEARFPQAVRWAWALNAAASVLGSAAAIFLAIYVGLRATLLAGACLYLGALSVVWLNRRSAANPAPVAVTANR
jgi:predicted MFS family arabinose efflux permease